ncbi:MAG: rhomboid family intramembrane serine protease [Caldilineaceae bacterium]|nr:rhomboid family intramembrane serine protease [Caldilineaceae bacterium]
MLKIDWRATALERSERLRQQLVQQAFILSTIVGVLWLIEIVDWLFLRGALDGQGIRPRTLAGLQGVVLAPFLHAGFGHLLANTIPLVILGWLVMMRRTLDFFWVGFGALVLSGLGIWLFGGAESVHLGISGIVFGFFGYLLSRAYYERSLLAILLGVLAFFVYGGMLWGLLPLQAGISWQGHLFGFVGGVVVAYFQVRNGTNRRSVR